MAHILPTQRRVGDRLIDEMGEYEVIGRPYTTAGSKTASVRVKRVDSDVQMIRVWGAHERIKVKRHEYWGAGARRDVRLDSRQPSSPRC